MRIVIDMQGCQGRQRFSRTGQDRAALVRAFLEQSSGHEVWLAFNAALCQGPDMLHAELSAYVPEDRFCFYDVVVPSAQRDAANRARGLASELVREDLIAGLDPDVVWTTSLFSGWFDDAAASVGRVRSRALNVISVDDADLDVRAPAPEAFRAWHCRQSSFLQRGDLLLVPSEQARQRIADRQQLPQSRIAAIGMGLTNIFPAMDGKDAHTVDLLRRLGVRDRFVFAGGDGGSSELHAVLEGYAALSPALRESHQLVLGGERAAEGENKLRDFILRAGLEPGRDVVHAGYLQDTDLAACYEACAAFVFSNPPGAPLRPLLQAMACGAPVLASDTTDVLGVAGAWEAVFDPDDTLQFASLLRKVLSEPAYAGRLKDEALRKARSFTWQGAAQAALQAMERLAADRAGPMPGAPFRPGGRPLMAYVSPMPPVQSGIADYSEQLLPALSAYYDIELVVDQIHVAKSCVTMAFPVRSLEWFRENAASYDRILYHMGNSPYHAHMPSLLRQYPGVVVLHDTYLTSLYEWMAAATGNADFYLNQLYDSHGFSALVSEKQQGRSYTRVHYPLSFSIFKDSLGVLLHSQYARQLVRDFYGERAAGAAAVVPFPKPAPAVSREQARRVLGLDDADFVVCTFGSLSAFKLVHRLVEGWDRAGLSRDARCRLVFVGQDNDDEFGRQLQERIGQLASKVEIIGFCDAGKYLNHLQAADVAVQLRAYSRGETSAAVFDCLAHGVPLIVNANGTMAELPDDVVLKLPDEFSDQALAEALDRLYEDADYRDRLSAAGRAFVQSWHRPQDAAAAYARAIEHFVAHGANARNGTFLDAFGRAMAGHRLGKNDLALIARAMVQGRPGVAQKQILVDVSTIVVDDLKTGIQRVVRNILKCLGEESLSGYRIEPMRCDGGTYVYARSYMQKLLGLDADFMVDDVVVVQRGDIVLGLDLALDMVIRSKDQYMAWRTRGAQVYFVVYDLLPVLRSGFFPPGSDASFREWLAVAAIVANGMICISKAVASELKGWLDQAMLPRQDALRIGYFHLGADQRLEIGSDANVQPASLDRLRADWPTVLMVGTVEPRKGHKETLQAFQELWSEGIAINLVVVGKHGWMVDELAGSLKRQQAEGKPVVWFEYADDALLQALYASSDLLLAASKGEGFGLPLIEAAQHRLDVLARDIPVFREVGGSAMKYFDNVPGGLARALRAWSGEWQRVKPEVRLIDGLQWLSWKQSATWLSSMLVDDRDEHWLYRWQGMEVIRRDFSEGLRVDVVCPQPGIVFDGWSMAESWGRWSQAEQAFVSIAYREEDLRERPLKVAMEGHAFLTAEHPAQRFVLLANNVETLRWEWRFGHAPHPIEASIPYQCLRARHRLELAIESIDCTRPSELGLSHDNRQLGIGLRSLYLGYEAHGASPASAHALENSDSA